MTIKIIKQPKEFKPEFADILYAPEFVEGEIDINSVDKLVLLPINVFNSLNPWENLKNRFDINYEDLKKACEYGCPWSNNIYYWLLPTWLVIRKNTVEDYKKLDTRLTGCSLDYAFDVEFLKKMNVIGIRDGNLELNNVILSFLGHGYTEFTLPNDGSRSIHLVTIALDNGDAILCPCWFWHNK